MNAVAATDPYECYNPGMAGTNAAPTYGCTITRSGVSGSYSYAAGDPNLPVVDVTFWDACRFANWLDNYQPTGPEGVGTTETGAYTLNGYNGSGGAGISRNGGATWAVTSENEWYKAAYYDPALNGGTGGYYEYATQSNTAPTATSSTAVHDSGNYNYAVGNTTDVGTYTGSASYYGTFDENGNVWDWNESVYDSSYRGIRGGSFDNSSLLASDYDSDDPGGGDVSVGFRVSEVPEPSSIIALLGGLVGLLGIRRRRS